MQHRQPDTHPLRLEGGPAHCQVVAPGVQLFDRGRKEAAWGPEWAFVFLVLEWASLCVLF